MMEKDEAWDYERQQGPSWRCAELLISQTLHQYQSSLHDRRMAALVLSFPFPRCQDVPSTY